MESDRKKLLLKRGAMGLTMGIAILLGLIWVSFLLPNPWLVLGVVTVLPAIYIATRYPGTIFAAYIYLPFYKAAAQSFVPVDLTIVLAVACGAILLIHIQKLLNRPSLAVMGIWSGVFGAVVIGTTYSANPGVLLYLVSFAALVFLPCMLAIVIARSPDYRRQFLFATAGLSGAVVVVGMVKIGAISGFGRLEVFGSTTIATARAALLIPTIVPFLWPSWSWRQRLVAVFGVMAAFGVGIATGSRGPLVAFAAALGAVMLFGRKQVLLTVFVFPVVTVLGIIMLQMDMIRSLLPEFAVARITSLIDAVLGRGDLDTSSMARVRLIDLALDMFAQRPVVGFGTASYEVFASQVPVISTHTYPHNLLVHVAAELGIVGLIATGVLLLAVFRSLLVGAPRDFDKLAIISLTVYALVNGMFSNGIFDNRWAWGMLVMAAALPSASGHAIEALPRGLRRRAATPAPTDTNDTGLKFSVRDAPLCLAARQRRDLPFPEQGGDSDNGITCRVTLR